MILGNDISRYQGGVDFKQMKRAGSQFVYMRLGIGYNKDKKVDEYRAQIKESGLPWGLYWLPWGDATNIQHMLNAYFDMVGDDAGDLPLALDVEMPGLSLGMFKMWAEQVIARTERKPVIYTRASHFDQYRDSHGIKAWLGQNTDLWVAHYTYSPYKPPAIPVGWDDYLIHQYSADENNLGELYGASSVAIDMDYFNGDGFKFAEFTGVGETEDPNIPDAQSKFVRVQNCGKPNGGWLYFRNRPELYKGASLAIGTGDVLKLLSPKKVEGDIDYWHIESDGYEGYVSAGETYTKEI